MWTYLLVASLVAALAVGKLVALWPSETRLGQAAQEKRHVRCYGCRIGHTNSGKHGMNDEFCFAVMGSCQFWLKKENEMIVAAQRHSSIEASRLAGRDC